MNESINHRNIAPDEVATFTSDEEALEGTFGLGLAGHSKEVDITKLHSYNRGVESYKSEFNEVLNDFELDFNIADWKGKNLLDIGSGATELFGREARKLGVNVVSVNPMLRHEKHREVLTNVQDSTNETLGDHNLAAYGQALPFKSDSFDGVVSVYGVPHYLHHVDGSLKYDDEILRGYTSEVRELDKEAITRTFEEIIRVLKPGGKAFLKDDHSSPGQAHFINANSPSDGSEVIEVLEGIEGIEFKIYEKVILIKEMFDRLRDEGTMRVIAITKLPTHTENNIS